MSIKNHIKQSVVAALLIAHAPVAVANGVGENASWQFQTEADRANKAFIEDMRQKAKNGYYAAPIYNTYIDRQYNCSVSSTALGNQGTSNAVGNSPSAGGHSTNATGNADASSVGQGIGDQTSDITGSQVNKGEVEAGASGEVETSVRGDTFQTLNTQQDNSGAQAANVNGSNACQFGPLN